MSELFGSELEALRAAVADHNRELSAMASWQQRMRDRVEKAEAKLASIGRYIEARNELGETVSGYEIAEIIEEQA